MDKRKSRVILPEEIVARGDEFEHLMASNLPQDEEFTGQENKANEGYDNLELEGSEEVPKADFFEVKITKDDTYGEIEGMEVVAADDDGDDGDDKFDKSGTMREHSNQMIGRASRSKTDEDYLKKKISSSIHSQKPSIQDNQDMTVSSSAQLGEEGDERKSRISKVTIVVDDEAPEYRKSVSKSGSFASTLKTQATSNVEVQSDNAISVLEERRSVRPTRPSIYYDISARLRSSEDLSQFFDLGKQDDFILLDELAETIEEESEPTITEEEEAALDRVPYYEKYSQLGEEIMTHRVRNNVLQKLVIMYFRRKKVENYLKETDPPLDQVIKYGQKLDAYQKFMEINETEREALASEVSSLRKKRDDKQRELEKLFKAMQTKEGNVGSGLIYAKTGNVISDKLVEKLIHRQGSQMEQVSTMRLKYIRLKGMVQEKLDAIDQLDNLGENLHLSYYEQMKMENRSYADKIEERDEELARLRMKCQNTIQILAHLREKSSALDSDLEDLQDTFNSNDMRARYRREDLAYLKHERDKYRNMSRKLREESGLLPHTDLLMDMEDSQKETELIKQELARCKEEVAIKQKNVRKLRIHIEHLTEEHNKRKTAKIKLKQSAFSNVNIEKRSKSHLQAEERNDMVYKSRPLLYMPIIKETEFNHLIKIRPTPTIPSKRKY